MCDLGIVLVYDITRKQTFENLVHWIKEVEQYCTGGLERVRLILIGNKLDLEAKREVRGHIVLLVLVNTLTTSLSSK